MRSFAQKHPVITFLLINFAWTWLFWFAVIPILEHPAVVTALVIIGGFGPAIGGILTLGLRSGATLDLSPKKIIAMLVAAAVIFVLLTMSYRADQINLAVIDILAALAASLVGGWVISSAVSRFPEIRGRMASILPWRMPVKWTILALVFYPAMILIAWGLSALVGAEVEYPAMWGRPTLEVLPLYALTFALILVAQGGNEEPGWRGVMQPELQKRFNPLVAALIVSVFWSLWHLPLYLNGVYGGDLVGGMLGGAVFRIFLAIFLAWFYNRSGGNLFLVIFLHTCFNTLVNFLPTSDLGLLVLWLIVTVLVVVKDKMWRKLPAALN